MSKKNFIKTPDTRYQPCGTLNWSAVGEDPVGLILEPRELKLYPNPRSPDIPMAEIE